MRFGHSVQREGGAVTQASQQPKPPVRLSSDTFLWAAAGSIGVSALLQILGRRHLSQFVGQWAPTFLLLGLYNKFAAHDFRALPTPPSGEGS
jgi:hypothetical protein